jgi:hypothetical protein
LEKKTKYAYGREIHFLVFIAACSRSKISLSATRKKVVMKQVATHLWIASSIAISCLATLKPTTGQIVPDKTLPVNSSVTPGCTVCTIEGGTMRGY